MQKYISVKEAAENLGVHYNTVRNMMKNGLLPFVRVGSNIRIPEKAIEDYLRDQAPKRVELVEGSFAEGEKVQLLIDGRQERRRVYKDTKIGKLYVVYHCKKIYQEEVEKWSS